MGEGSEWHSERVRTRFLSNRLGGSSSEACRHRERRADRRLEASGENGVQSKEKKYYQRSTKTSSKSPRMHLCESPASPSIRQRGDRELSCNETTSHCAVLLTSVSREYCQSTAGHCRHGRQVEWTRSAETCSEARRSLRTSLRRRTVSEIHSR